MKKRFGFVSNSSSTSFLLYGVSINEEKLQALYSAVSGHPSSADEAFYSLKKECNIEGYEHYGTYYLGVSASCVKDSETGKEFRDRVKIQMEKYFPNEAVFGYIKESWYEG